MTIPPSARSVLDAFLAAARPDTRAMVLKLTDIILSVDAELAVAVKWNRLTFAWQGDFHHWICGIAKVKRGVSLVFHFGGLLEDANKLFQSGSSLFFRKIDLASIDDIHERGIKDFVRQAIGKRDYFKANWKELNKKK